MAWVGGVVETSALAKGFASSPSSDSPEQSCEADAFGDGSCSAEHSVPCGDAAAGCGSGDLCLISRKRHLRQGSLQPVAPFGGSIVSASLQHGGAEDNATGVPNHLTDNSVYADESVAALLPKMKRMRLRPSLGQLRLQREADEVASALFCSPQVRLLVEPEQLRAAVTLLLPVSIFGCEVVATHMPGGPVNVELELTFPPQYPHKPPKISQVSPSRRLQAWQYDGSLVLLPRLTDRCWSPAMGVADIIRDLFLPLGLDGDTRGGSHLSVLTSVAVPLPVPMVASAPQDVEML